MKNEILEHGFYFKAKNELFECILTWKEVLGHRQNFPRDVLEIDRILVLLILARYFVFRTNDTFMRHMKVYESA